MTMANLIVQGDRAHLLTDSGYFRSDGTIAALFPKSMVFEKLSLAVALTGSGMHCGHLAEQARNASLHDVDGFLRWIMPATRAAYAATKLDPVVEWARVLIAFYSPEKGRAYGCTFFTAPEAGPADLKPWRIYPVSKVLMPEIVEADVFGPDVDVRDPALFDPAREALPLIEAQRRPGRVWETVVPGCYVAGDIDLTTVSRDGVEVRTLQTFPDVVGRKAGERV